MGFVKKLKKARHKLRAKARGLTVVELAELEVLKQATEKRERMKHKRWKTKEKVKQKYRRKRASVETGGGGGKLETAKKAWGWLQTRGEHAQRRLESGALSGSGRRVMNFDELADRLVLGRKKEKQRSGEADVTIIIKRRKKRKRK